jgi:hypothetical protein
MDYVLPPESVRGMVSTGDHKLDLPIRHSVARCTALLAIVLTTAGDARLSATGTKLIAIDTHRSPSTLSDLGRPDDEPSGGPRHLERPAEPESYVPPRSPDLGSTYVLSRRRLDPAPKDWVLKLALHLPDVVPWTDEIRTDEIRVVRVWAIDKGGSADLMI